MAAKTGRVRIIAGSLKGKSLRYPPGRDIRPSMQQVKAAVFDSLGDELRGAVFVDLFAGAGGVGLEAISRGAKFVHFVENNRTALELLRANLTSCAVDERRAKIYPVSVFDFLSEGDACERIAPDILYADPPYDTAEPGMLIASINSLHYIGNCTIIMEHRRDLPVEEISAVKRTRLKKFGRSWVSFFDSTEGYP
ncbi:MAG: 16S rRNA (guanine(966)-N(2))-methyltransferase RsmD [Candidatus Latescibacterota bacterium]